MNKEVFSLKNLSQDARVTIRPLSKGRYLIGASNTCDIIINHSSIRSIHAVLEITPSGNKIYALDSDSIILVNGEKQVVSKLILGDTLKVGNVVLNFETYADQDFDIPTIPSFTIPRDSNSTKTGSVIRSESKPSEDAPRLIYPFNHEYNFETSEYIFEDNKDIYPIFKYEQEQQAVEVIIVFKNRIFSVDYLNRKDGVYRLVGFRKDKKNVEYPYMGENDKVDFIESKGGTFFVNNLSGYSRNIFSDKNKVDQTSSLILDYNDIVSFQKDDLSIIVRNVESPPVVSPPPLLPRDKSLLLLCLLGIFLMSIPMYFFYTTTVDKEKVEKEKAPERIAKILYKKKPLPKIVKKTPTKSEPTLTKKVQKKSVKEVKKIAKKAPGPKIPKKKTPVKKVKKGTPPKKVNNSKKAGPPKKTKSKKSSSKAVGRSKSKSTTSSPTPKSRGTVDVYKSNKFKSSLSALLAKGGQFKGVKTKGASSGSFAGPGAQGVAGGGGVSSAKVSDVIGSPNGSKNGVQDFASGAQGLVGTKTFYTAGIPSETVVVGSMDPDLIRKILRDHIPQFRFCYQKELDKTSSNFQGVIKLAFIIGASGSVTKAGVNGRSRISGRVKSCVVNVLRGIQFPKPLGGGQVEVKQPLNFFPRSK